MFVIKKSETINPYTLDLQFNVVGDSEYYFNDEYAGTVAENACISITYMKPGLLKVVNNEKVVTIYIDESFDKNSIEISKEKGKLIYTISNVSTDIIDKSIKTFVMFIVISVIVLGIIFALYMFLNSKETIDGNYEATNTKIGYTSNKTLGDFRKVTYKYYPENMNVTFKNGMYSVSYDVYGCIASSGCVERTKVDSVSASGTYTVKNDTLYLELGNGTKRTCIINKGDKTTIDCTRTGGWYYTKK